MLIKWRGSGEGREEPYDRGRSGLQIAEFLRENLFPIDLEMIQPMLAAAKHERLKKGERAVEAGEVQNQISFLVHGILRGYVIDENGRDITDCFAYRPGDVVMGCNGLVEPSQINIEALTECELVQVPVSVLIGLMERYPVLHQVHSKLLLESLERHWGMKRILYQSAMQRYQWFLTTYPGLIDCVSNKYIASFLGITPVTLSRLRRQLREENM